MIDYKTLTMSFIQDGTPVEIRSHPLLTFGHFSSTSKAHGLNSCRIGLFPHPNPPIILRLRSLRNSPPPQLSLLLHRVLISPPLHPSHGPSPKPPHKPSNPPSPQSLIHPLSIFAI